MWQTYLQPADLDQALHLLQEHAVKPASSLAAPMWWLSYHAACGQPPHSIDITGLRELKYVRMDGDMIRLGALATHNDVIAATRAGSTPAPWPRHAGKSARRRSARGRPWRVTW